MASASGPAKAVRILVVAALAFALLIGIGTGISIASTINLRNTEDFIGQQVDLPTKIYDIKGRLITEFYSEQKRELISIRELPRHLIDAFLVREDRSFYTHHGFSIKDTLRAVYGVLTNQSLGGGSTITQQLAGTLLNIRTDISISRKLVELWYALQLERRYTKEEILEQYLNLLVMGSGVYGVEAASKYFFNHSAREISLAESAILVIQLSSPTKYDPFRNPNNARSRSKSILDDMVRYGYATKEEVESSFDEYWSSFDFTRVASGAYFNRDDQAPWFSEYVRRQLDEMLYGSLDYYRDGFIVNTTLDLDQQYAADSAMQKGLAEVNKTYQAESAMRLGPAEETYIPIVEALGLIFDLEDIFVPEAKMRNATLEYYKKRINPTIDAVSLLFGLPDLKTIANASSARTVSDLAKTTVEGALVTIENETGHITSIVGGSRYEGSNQWIRATQSELMPGSTFKPLYYSAAIDSRKFTEATLIYDAPVQFIKEDGIPYTPLNYKGEWKGPVLTWYALAQSMNVPSLKVLDSIGFDAAIERASILLDITDPVQIRTTFPRLYPLGLGVIGVTPLRMARAYAVFANGGKEVTPIAIRSVEDRNGHIILEPEKDLRTQQKKKGSAIQVVSPQNAAIMVDMLQRVIAKGTLQGWTGGGTAFTYKDAQGAKYTIPAAGKTGTTNNWEDAWTIGFTPYLTTAIWFGFDSRGNSLGISQSGAAIAGKYWTSYMKEIHEGLPNKGFSRPQTGLAEATVCSVSGLLPTPYCNEGSISLLFYEGTQPNRFCDIHSLNIDRDRILIDKLGEQMQILDEVPPLDTSLRLDLPVAEPAPPASEETLENRSDEEQSAILN